MAGSGRCRGRALTRLRAGADAHYATDWWDDTAGRAFVERAAAAEWDWLTRNDPPPPALPDPWCHDKETR